MPSYYQPEQQSPAPSGFEKVKEKYDDPLVADRLCEALYNCFQSLNPSPERNLVVVAIGTDRSTGDSLGPLVGSRLEELDQEKLMAIYGTLDNPVHASNLTATLQLIEREHPGAFIIAVDASLGQSESVGSITIAAGALKPGTGVNKNLPQVGDIHITGIVNVGGYMEYFVLQNTRLSLVVKMANQIAATIYSTYQQTLAQANGSQGLSAIQ